MAASTLDSILNFAVPTLIILVVIGFVWIKTPLGAWLGPIFSGWWDSIRNREHSGGGFGVEMQKVITYE